MSRPLDRLRYHVTGAIERGEAKPIVEVRDESRFVEGSTFDGAEMPRFDDMPNGPKMQSMTFCKCGAPWKSHRFVDGACPTKKGA